jgi:hypothetical protein
MVRHATNEALTVLGGARIERTLRIQADEEGVLHLAPELLAGLREGDALELPDPLPTCESCWAEPAVAIALCPGSEATFKGETCAAGRDLPPPTRFVPLISSSAGRTLRKDQVGA